MKKLKGIIILLEILKWGMLLLLSGVTIFLLVSDEPVINLSTSNVILNDTQTENELHSLLKFGEYQLLATEYDLEFPASMETKVASAIAALLAIIYFFWVFQLIINLVKSVQSGQSFSRENITRLKRIALLVIIGPILLWILQYGYMAYFISLHELPEQLGLQFHMQLNFGVLIMGLLLYAIAIAFGEGLKMREEQELTI